MIDNLTIVEHSVWSPNDDVTLPCAGESNFKKTSQSLESFNKVKEKSTVVRKLEDQLMLGSDKILKTSPSLLSPRQNRSSRENSIH